MGLIGPDQPGAASANLANILRRGAFLDGFADPVSESVDFLYGFFGHDWNNT